MEIRKIGIIGGSGTHDTILFKNVKPMKITTPYGPPSSTLEVCNFNKDVTVSFLARHGKDHKIPPHKINYHANIWSLKKWGANKIISITSVGSLKKSIKPPSIMIPNDYINFWKIPTYHDKEIVHVTPGLDEKLRKIIISCAKKLKNVKIYEKGIYAQTTGPRLETRAEINLLRNYADVVGMNMANEATLAKELEIGFANISSIDNYGNGIIEQQLTFEQILRNAKQNFTMVKELLINVIGAIK